MNIKTRLATIAIVFVVTVLWLVPNFLEPGSAWPIKDRMTLGLDIQGGSHLVLKVDADSAIRSETRRMLADVEKNLAEKKHNVSKIEVTDELKVGLKVTLGSASEVKSAHEEITKMYGDIFTIVEGSDSLSMEYGEIYLRDWRKRLVEQAIETIRNRIDQFGVAEPSITAQGTDRILVQLPGIKDVTAAKDLINRTAKLEFMILSPDVKSEDLTKWIEEAEKSANINFKETKYTVYIEKLNEALKGKLPPNTKVLFQKDEAATSLEVGRQPIVLKTDETVTGEHLVNANVSAGEMGGPVVGFSFDAQGAKQFGELTKKNVKKPMAIVLDEVVKSVANIQEPITQGRGQITLGGGRDVNKALDDAKIIAVALRAGALPARLDQIEERTVGPSLGADAIEKGKFATIMASVAVFLFLILYYRGFGVVAALALSFNLLITVAVLSALRATLTLPGVAGLGLTVGMAVDAFVIIFERIKEEKGKGANLVMAMREGYNRAFSSILDANVSTLLVCVILMYYGTGPIRGFAVTLVCGLATSMFTALYFARGILELLLGRWQWKLSVQWGEK